MRKLLLVMFLAFIPQLALAENTPAPVAAKVIKGDFKSMKHTSSNRVDAVIDAQTILMKDGKIIRLLGLGYPLPTGEDIDNSTIAAKERLEALLPEATEVMLYQKRQVGEAKRGRVNRMGHLLAHLVKKENEEWINGTIASEGLAWIVTDTANPEMADQLYAFETKARKEAKGLWAKDSAHGLLTADTAAQGEGQFRVVEGTVNRAATSKNNLYLNFGTDMRKDFTVMVSADLRRQLSRKEVDAMSLAGKTIRVRGWLRNWNGPFMELETPERLEIVTTSGPSTEPPPEPSTEPVEKEQPKPQTGQLNP
jgi:micrococcal nuclease